MVVFVLKPIDGSGMTLIFAVMVVGQSFSFTVALTSFDCVKNRVGFLHPLHDTTYSSDYLSYSKYPL